MKWILNILIDKLFLLSYNHQLKYMIPIRLSKQVNKRSAGETKPTPIYEYKFSQQVPSNKFHNRSSSTDKNKKLRIMTEYDDTEGKYSQEKNNRKGYNSKKSKMHDYKMIGVNDIHSTKSNPKKNMDLRLLFNKSEQNQDQKVKNKGYTTHHPLLKYVTKQK